MSTSIASQLQAIKSRLKGSEDPIRRPVTRPSVLFDPKEAADIDLRTILPIAVSGLEVLAGLDARFGSYRGTLFVHTSLELDREKMVPKEEERVNKSVTSYLRLLSGHLQLPAALKTLEYLIRRYLVHVFNIDELILCALPYHDTHAFVRIVQLLDLGNKKWGFLEGVKASGAALPRKVIVQQCIRDKGILETFCNYALSTKEFHHSRPVICFFTAVIVEALGAVPQVDSDTVKRVLPFVFNGFNTATKGSQDHKAGALMIVGLLASRATLAPKLIHSLISFIARMAQQDARESSDLPWLRMILMAIISLIQAQSIQMIPKKSLKILIEIRDLTGIITGLSEEFNIERFLCIYLETLVDYSSYDDSCRLALINTIEAIPLNFFVENIVTKVLSFCTKLSQGVENTNLPEAGIWAKQILVVMDRHYPSELRGAVHKFLEKSKPFCKEGEAIFKTLCLMVDGSVDVALEISDSKIWFSLEHPKAAVRQAALSGLASSGILKLKDSDSQKLVNVQDAILRRLHDDDLSVVQAALSIDGLSEIISPPCLLKAFQDVVFRCIDILKTSTLRIASQACEVAVSCLESMVLNFQLPQFDHSKEVATMMFPLLLVLPKTWRVNLKALELARKIRWSFYCDSSVSYDPPPTGKIKNIEPGSVTSINMKTVGALAESFIRNPGGYVQWLIGCCRSNEASKSLFFLIVLQAILVHKEDVCCLLKLFQDCFPAFKHEWCNMVSQGNIVLTEEFSVEKLDNTCKGVVDQLLLCNSEVINANALICIFWSLLKAFSMSIQRDAWANNSEWSSMLEDLFAFFATSAPRNVYKEHILLLVRKCSISPVQFLSKFYTVEGFSVAVQVESLLCFAMICSMSAEAEQSNINDSDHLQYLTGFPSLLVPLSNQNKDIRTAALDCVEELHKLLHHWDISKGKNGIGTLLSHCISTPLFDEFLGSIVSQKKLISSDGNFLSSFLTSMLTSGQNLLVPQSIDKRFDQQAKDTLLNLILSSALKFSSYGKLRVLSLFRAMGNAILQIEEVKLLLIELLERWKKWHCGCAKSLCNELSQIEIDTLCLLLEASLLPFGFGHAGADFIVYPVQALKIDGASLEDPAIVKPCVTILQNLTSAFYDSLKTEIQDELFGNLVILFRCDNGDIRNAAREALLRINISYSTIVKLLEFILARGHQSGSLNKIKKKKLSVHHESGLDHDLSNRGESTLSFLNSLLDILLLKKDLKRRECLVEPLFKLLGELFSNDWIHALIDEDKKRKESSSDIPEIVTEAICFVQQSTLLILEEISATVRCGVLVVDDIFSKFNISMLVECARNTQDVMTHNHVFLLLSSLAKISSQWVSEHIIDLFTIIGDSATKQNDSHSQHVIEDLISTLVPCWLSTTNSTKNLLQVFVNVLPGVAEHRRLTLMVYLLRTLGEKGSLGILLYLLFHSLVLRRNKSSVCEGNIYDFSSSASDLHMEWEYMFATQMCDQYSCRIWLPCLVVLLQEFRMDNQHEEIFSEICLAMQFILQKLQDTEIAFEVESGQDSDYHQSILGALMEQVVLHLQLVDVKNKHACIKRSARKQLKECMCRVLKSITKRMVLSEFFKSITRLLGHEDGKIKKKALSFLCETVKDHNLVQKKTKETRKYKLHYGTYCLRMDESAMESFTEMCSKIVQLVDGSIEVLSTPAKLVAISSLEVLAKEFPSNNCISMSCLTAVVKNISSNNLAISSGCLRSTGALISVLGSKALSEIPCIMKHVLERAHEVSNCPSGMFEHSHTLALDDHSSVRESILMSVLVSLEAVVENLGSFLNPYIENVLDLMLLHLEYASESDQKVKQKAAIVRKLITEKIPVRLLLAPLLKIYPEALRCGETSLSLAFEMISSTVGTMDKSSIGSYHAKIFERCLVALDLRRQNPESVKNVSMIEENVINTIIVLTMKLTESMFRPLFLRSLDWANAELEESESTRKSLDRCISFYRLVNKLTEQHRSLFIPYFKYLIEGCTCHLTNDQDVHLAASLKKRKKTKPAETCNETKETGMLSPKQWHLRALILMSLYKCFLYDTGRLKFLDATNFQVLLKPIVSQLVAEPPVSLEDFLDLPSIDLVDDSLVCCLGQMAVTVGSDDIWKQLNHEVLMQTRNEKVVRARILGLRVVKYLVEHLKEEYLVCLPETIPFLSERLEDLELPVRSLAQWLLRELESLGGESLRHLL